MLNQFIKDCIINPVYPTEEQRIKERWDVSGTIHKYSNKEYKFNARPMDKMEDGLFGKKGSTNIKAEKLVFNTVNEWVILDIEELHKYIKSNNLKIIHLDDLINNLEWNMYIAKK